MTHPHNSEILINGETHKLRLTLGALAQIEERLGGDFEALQERLKSPRVSDIIVILHALLMGGGGALSLSVLKASDLDLGDAARAIATAFEAFGPDQEAPGKPEAPSGSSAAA